MVTLFLAEISFSRKIPLVLIKLGSAEPSLGTTGLKNVSWGY